MRAGGRQAAIDNFRLLAATLVIAIHTSPLATYWETGDFWLTRVLARIAVPFFFMVSGYFLARSNWKNTGRFVKKTLLLYGVAVALYLPLNWYSGGYFLGEWVQKLLLECLRFILVHLAPEGADRNFHVCLYPFPRFGR